MPLHARSRLASFAALCLSLAHCGPGLPGDSNLAAGAEGGPVVGAWRGQSTTSEVTNVLTYASDGSYSLVTSVSTSGALAGCVTRATTRGRYVITGDQLTQFDATGTSSRSGCADPGQNVPESPRPSSQSMTFNRTYTWAVEGDELRLTTETGTTLRWTRR